jgi:hypothetical protein
MLGRDSNPGWGQTQAHGHPRRLDYFGPWCHECFCKAYLARTWRRLNW